MSHITAVWRVRVIFNARVQFNVDLELFYELLITTPTTFAGACRPELQSIDCRTSRRSNPLKKELTRIGLEHNINI
jgi:hypothetical protein